MSRVTTSLKPRSSYYNHVRNLWKQRFSSMETMHEAHEARTNLAKLEIYYEVLLNIPKSKKIHNTKKQISPSKLQLIY